MARKKSPRTLRKLCMMRISVKFELVCYGMERTDKGCKKFIENIIKHVDLAEMPVSYLPASVLYDLMEETVAERTCSHHILHLLLQPHLRRCKIPAKINTRTAFHLLVARCSNLTQLEIPKCKVNQTWKLLESKGKIAYSADNKNFVSLYILLTSYT